MSSKVYKLQEKPAAAARLCIVLSLLLLYYILPVGFLMPCVCPVCAYILRHVKQPRSRKESKKLDFAKKPLYTVYAAAAAIHKVYNDVHRSSYVLKRPELKRVCAKGSLRRYRESAGTTGNDSRTNFWCFLSFCSTRKCVHVTSRLHGRRSISRRRISKSEENQKKLLAFCSDG